MTGIVEQIAYCVERGKTDRSAKFPADMAGQAGADELTEQALREGIHPGVILNLGLISGMQRIGAKFKQGKAFVPEVLIAAKAMKTAMRRLEPFFLSQELRYRGTIVLGTVAGDLHDIGKNIVGMLLQGGGWRIIDLGVNVPAERFAAAVLEHDSQAIGLSALLTTTMMNMEAAILAVRKYSPSVKILVGGAPLSKSFAEQIGADCYSPDPQGALEYLNSIA